MNAEIFKRAIDYAVDNGAKVINCSWHFKHTLVGQAVKRALNKGCIVVFAAGNDGTGEISYPASCDGRILVVGAIDKYGKRACFSNYGSGLDVMAPGENVYSLLPGNNVVMDSGTSFSAPQVSGLAAMILSKYPDASAEEVRYRIPKTARKVGQGDRYNYSAQNSLGSWNNEMGYGLIDEYAALSLKIPYRYKINVTNSSNFQPMIAAKIVIYNSDYSLANVTVVNDFEVLYSGQEMTAYCDLLPGNYIINIYPENAGDEYEIDYEINARKGGEISFEFTGSRIGEYEWETPSYLPYCYLPY